MKNKAFLIFWVFWSFSFVSQTQETPPINIYNPVDYQAEPQNWSISQSSERYIYVANNKGLLEYNGTKWTLYPSPNGTKMRSIAIIDSLVYTGSYHNFGFWEKDEFGVLNYTSLSNLLKVNFLEDEEFWNILSYDNWILFQSLNRIHMYNTKTKAYNIIDPDADISKLIKVRDVFYFQVLNKGLYRIENGEQVLASENSVIKNSLIINIFKNDDETLVLTQDKGFLKLIENTLVPWNISSNSFLKTVSVFSAIQLRDESFILGTISHGVIHLSKNGQIITTINQSDGLSNNTVLSLYEDLDNNIWLGLDNGINCINIKSPYHIYYDKNGTVGSVYTSIFYEGTLYLGTNQGLFYRKLQDNKPFQFVEGTQGQVWFLDIINETLFCGHNSGTFIIKNTKANKIANIQGTWQIKNIEGNNELLIQGNYDGLNILEKKNDKWVYKNKLEGFDISSRFFEFINKDELYVNHEYKGLFKLRLNKDLTKVEKYTKDTLIKNGLSSCLVKHGKHLLYSNKNGVYKYDESKKQYLKDSLLSKLMISDDFTSGKLISDLKTNKLWSFSSKGINYFTSENLGGEKKVNTLTFPSDIRNDIFGYENITHINEEQFLIGSTTGYTILDLDKITNLEYKITINQIVTKRLKNNDSTNLLSLDSWVELDNKENNIQFSYSIPEFLKTQKPEYQYKLEGIYDTWSEWTTDGNVSFENLPFGDYTFKVNGRVGNQKTLNTASFSFSIERPLYATNTAIALYIIALILFGILLHNTYKRYYRKQRERLMLKSTRELELKELENKQQLMRFRNEKLREDIETKNRELGISTMSLIKKNEFLSSIKKELEKADNVRSIKQVVKIIDRNLNNNDDWNLFQEAFNNADKDFLKKIKELHPELTSNDLRLCAYLRLNLSSKEIAPLLNISPRSVEVKRYRLRKKMNLPHEASLTNYILEV